MDDMDRRISPHQWTDVGPMGDIVELPQDYRLTTAEILYHLPDFPDLTQSYLWQSLDRLPDFPKLNRFLSGWEKELKGELHSVRIGYVSIIQPAEWHFSDCTMTNH